jgi:hypothetical protein
MKKTGFDSQRGLDMDRDTLTIILYALAAVFVIGMFVSATKRHGAMTLACGVVVIGCLIEIQTLIFEHILHLINH